MARAKKLYRLTDGDRELFRYADTEPNFFTDYYLRSDWSGTWYFPGARREIWKRPYEALFMHWVNLGKPDHFEISGRMYRAEMEYEKADQYPGEPAFNVNHGELFIPYNEDLHKDRTPFRTVIGGLGAGKTRGWATSALIHAATKPNFQAFVLAPRARQVEEVFNIMMQLIAGTLYEERFYIRDTAGKRFKIEIGNEFTGLNTIEFFPIADDMSKLLTLSGDMALVDQAESELLHLPTIMRMIGTRFRGRDPKTGRSRIGTLTFVANAAYNPILWQIFDRAKIKPKKYKSYNPSTYDNPFLTDDDLDRFEETVGGTEEAIRVHLYAKRPRGEGQHFSQSVIDAMQSSILQETMAKGLDEEKPGFYYAETAEAGIVTYEMPPVPGRKYLVISDPGTGKPPDRDAPCIMVWDITDFPGTKSSPRPASLQAFRWFDGKRDINHWASTYNELVHRYNAELTNGFDATGFQAGYDQWLTILDSLIPEKMSLSGNGKYLALNSAKMLAGRHMFAVPADLDPVFEHLAMYMTPEPDHFAQDVTMTFFLSAQWLQRLYYIDDSDEFAEEDNHFRVPRRAKQAKDRYSWKKRGQIWRPGRN